MQFHTTANYNFRSALRGRKVRRMTKTDGETWCLSGAWHPRSAYWWTLDILCAGVESEWRKTQCRPREVCVDVGREFGVPTNIFYKPPCVSVYRCGGCCHSEDKQCRNISTGYLSKTVSSCLFSQLSLYLSGCYCIISFMVSHNLSNPLCIYSFGVRG